mmetsp:Transcript_1831/g.4261  ORF Transcript_1831/g.4261 Transcript_1831/m.4261 type:complete len:220 (+) Transcript_1831:1968-2627(+)
MGFGRNQNGLYRISEFHTIIGCLKLSVEDVDGSFQNVLASLLNSVKDYPRQKNVPNGNRRQVCPSQKGVFQCHLNLYRQIVKFEVLHVNVRQVQVVHVNVRQVQAVHVNVWKVQAVQMKVLEVKMRLVLCFSLVLILLEKRLSFSLLGRVRIVHVCFLFVLAACGASTNTVRAAANHIEIDRGSNLFGRRHDCCCHSYLRRRERTSFHLVVSPPLSRWC